MNFVPIFAGSNPAESLIWSVQYPGEPKDELGRLFDDWNDPIYIREFLENNRQDFETPFWQQLSISQAVFRIMDEAADMEDLLSSVEEANKTGNNEFVREVFEPLHKAASLRFPQIFKGKATNSKPFLRLYGLELEDGQFIITGGGIKLTRSNQESPHIELETQKTESVKAFLEANSIYFLPYE